MDPARFEPRLEARGVRRQTLVRADDQRAARRRALRQDAEDLALARVVKVGEGQVAAEDEPEEPPRRVVADVLLEQGNFD